MVLACAGRHQGNAGERAGARVLLEARCLLQPQVSRPAVEHDGADRLLRGELERFLHACRQRHRETVYLQYMAQHQIELRVLRIDRHEWLHELGDVALEGRAGRGKNGVKITLAGSCATTGSVNRKRGKPIERFLNKLSEFACRHKEAALHASRALPAVPRVASSIPLCNNLASQ
ncbi:hypothetical protein RFN31_21545 [Mesorhizobium sp. VK3C]|nr:hypothetical protein [Mesorhizobium sp. VK3C]